MTAYRNRTPDAEAAQYQPTTAEPLAFSDRPDWLEQELEHNRIIVRTHPGGAPYLSVQGGGGVHLAEPGAWIVRDRWGHIDVLDADRFAAEYDVFEEPSTTPPKTAPADATRPQEASETEGATK